ncbi:MAG: helix-turn-helix domain-containing protein [Clostridiales bacterium]|jgi:transcriptional regulator with XRE-family HTH domain|nr:helix-turn-helix domain-containing protein [Clostridiales bacterium]
MTKKEAVANMSIGERIALALERSGKSKADLARYLATRSSTVENWIKCGSVPAATAIMPICEFTGVSLEWILSEDNETVQTRQKTAENKPSVERCGRNLSLKIAELRKKHNVTLSQLGRELGIKPQSVSLLEKGVNAPSFETLILLADFFDVSIDWLVGEGGEIDKNERLVLKSDERELLAEYKRLDEKSKARVSERVKVLLE